MAQLRLQQVVVGRWLRLRLRLRLWRGRGRRCRSRSGRGRGRCCSCCLHALLGKDFHFSLAKKKKRNKARRTFAAHASLNRQSQSPSQSPSQSLSPSRRSTLGTWLPAIDSCLQQLTNIDCLNWPRSCGAFNPDGVAPRKNHGIKIIAAAHTPRFAATRLYSTLCKAPKKFVFPYLYTL